MNSYKITELSDSSYFTSDVFLDKNFLILPNSVLFNKEITKAMMEWQFTEVISEGTIVNSYEAALYSSDQSSPKQSAPEIVPKVQEKSKQKTQIAEDPDLKIIEQVKLKYEEFKTYINTVYTRFATHKELNLNAISEKVKEMCIYIKDNRKYVLRLKPEMDPDEKNFLVNHSLRTTVLSIAMGLHLHFALDKLIELGVSSVLHEIGMLRLPPQLYLSDRKLTPQEKNSITTHPVISYNILKGFNFPITICRGVLEHHEKWNGQGYPRRLSQDGISLYARIISVACSYEAITAPRTYKDPLSTHQAMVELLKNVGKQYDDTVIRALLCCLSLYPIGAYVVLSNGKIGQITDVNPENPKNPIVYLLNEPEESTRTIETDDTNITVTRVLEKKEIDILLKRN